MEQRLRLPAGDMVSAVVLWPSTEPCAPCVPGVAERDVEEPRVQDVPGGQQPAALGPLQGLPK